MPLFPGRFLIVFAGKEFHHLLVSLSPINILSASLLVDLVSWLIRSRLLQSVTLSFATVLLIAVPAKTSFEYSYRKTMPDTRVLAKDWIEKNIPPNHKILMDSGKYYLGKY